MAEHYFSKEQTSPLKLHEIHARLRGIDIDIISASGMFSISKVDIGSQLLIDDCIIEDGQKVLDLGCGYGPVGIVIAKTCPSCNVTFTDINQRAVKVAKMNAKKHKLSNVSFAQGNMYEKVDDDFDVILLNPPHTAGKDVCFSMIEQAKDHLKAGGNLQIVARHKKGGKTLSEKMKEVFGNMEEVSKKSGYRIYMSIKE